DNVPTFAPSCYRTFVQFLESSVKPIAWSGDIIAADIFPSVGIPGDLALQNTLSAFQVQKTNAFMFANNFVRQTKTGMPSVAVMARIWQPVVDVHNSRSLDALFLSSDLASRLGDLKCNDRKTLLQPQL